MATTEQIEIAYYRKAGVENGCPNIVNGQRCGNKQCPVIGKPGSKTRWHKCTVCGYNFKSVEK